MTGTDFWVNKPHMSRLYLNHLVFGIYGLQTANTFANKRIVNHTKKQSTSPICLIFWFHSNILTQLSPLQSINQ